MSQTAQSKPGQSKPGQGGQGGRGRGPPVYGRGPPGAAASARPKRRREPEEEVWVPKTISVSDTHLTLPTTPYV